MKKYALKLALLALTAMQSHGMWRTAMRLSKTFIEKSIARLPKSPTTLVKNTQMPIAHSRFASFKASARITLKPQWQKINWRAPRLIFGAASLTAAALLAQPYKAYAQSKEHDAQQSMPAASVWQLYAQGIRLSRHEMIEQFNRDCALHAHENNAIPAHISNDESVRVATYNVHMWKDAHGAKNFDAIMNTISQVNADVLVLQEVLMFDKEYIMKRLKELGYVHTSAGRTATFGGTFFGNMVVSKYPFNTSASLIKTYDADQKYPGERRCYIKSTVQLPQNKEITVYGTHLDVYDETENLRTQEIQELIADSAHSKTPCIIAADYNAVRKKDYQYEVNGKSVWAMLNESNKKRTGMPTQTRALETLEQHNFVDSFTSNNQQNPRATVWSGTAVDFLYLNDAWQKQNADLSLGKSYVYYSSASDHLPILMDMTIKKH